MPMQVNEDIVLSSTSRIRTSPFAGFLHTHARSHYSNFSVDFQRKNSRYPTALFRKRSVLLAQSDGSIEGIVCLSGLAFECNYWWGAAFAFCTRRDFSVSGWQCARARVKRFESLTFFPRPRSASFAFVFQSSGQIRFSRRLKASTALSNGIIV